MLLPEDLRLGIRQATPPPGNASSKTTIIVAVVVSIVIFISLLVLAYVIAKVIRLRHPNPRYIPTNALKRRWERWQPRGLTRSKGRYSDRLQDDPSVPTLHLRSENRSARNSALSVADPERGLAMAQGRSDATQETDATVDRHTSVRSVMTLPAYSRSVRDSERVLGREGERAGIDVVVEAPETAEEEEERRDEEMESLYQIRRQRREEIAEREDLRRRRREARARGDYPEIMRTHAEGRRLAEQREIAGATAMIAEHQSRSRERRVSSVSYGDLGVARHDGTRLRANSNESDRPLLDSAASMSGAASIRPWSTRDSHHRDRSASSFISNYSDASEIDVEPPPFGRAGSAFEVVVMNQGQGHSRTGSGLHTPMSTRSRASSLTAPSTLPFRPPPPEDAASDVGESHMSTQQNQPPSYDDPGFEDAPPYTSPVREQAPEPLPLPPPMTRPSPAERHYSQSGAPLLPEIGRLPSIRIADATPVERSADVQWPSPRQ